MSCGLPVVVSPHAGVSEWLTDSLDSIVMQDPENADELAQAIHKLVLDSELRGSIVANAIQTARKLSWANHSEKLRNVLASAVEQKLLRSSKRGF
jgi:UDP-glucose:(heptosyl)LPS alpha-1,3-glucosyltransferase